MRPTEAEEEGVCERGNHSLLPIKKLKLINLNANDLFG